jgi:hypothetical protein
MSLDVIRAPDIAFADQGRHGAQSSRRPNIRESTRRIETDQINV